MSQVPPDGPPSITVADAQSVSRKLQDFRETLPPNEQAVLDALGQMLAARASEPQVQDLLKDFPDAPELLEDVSAFSLRASQQPTQAATPTTTITITITIGQSRPFLCNLSAGQ